MIEDPLRAEQLKLAKAGSECRAFMEGIGGAVVKNLREQAIDRLTSLPAHKRHDDLRFRLTLAVRVIDDFAETVLRAAEQGEEAAASLKKWLEENGKKELFNGWW